MAPASSPAAGLPSDCQLHVFLHLDPVSTVRCAAVSRHWRRAVVDNAREIRRHPRGHADRCLLLGFYHREMYPGELAFSRCSSWSPPAPAVGRPHWSDSLPAPSCLPAAEDGRTKTKLYAPLASSDGLLLLCRGLPAELSVCNPLTGFHATVPRLGALAPSRYALHSCHAGADADHPRPNSFQVLAVAVEGRDGLALQNYRSDTRAWGPVFRPGAGEIRMPDRHDYRAAPVVCRGAIHWLCSSASDYSPGRLCFVQITRVVAVEVASRRVRMTRLPKQCSMNNYQVSERKLLMLATAQGDRLSLLRGEEASFDVSVWLHVGDHGAGDGDDDPEKSWLLWRSIDVRKLIEDAGLSRFRLDCKDWSVLQSRLEWFCPRSRCVIIWIPYLGLFVLDMESQQIQRAAGDSHGHIWPFEIDLTLSLCSMKPF